MDKTQARMQMDTKAQAELVYWRNIKQKTKNAPLSCSHYEYFYTTHFSLSKSFYNNKRVLDIGCGPRGSLEWADNTQQRIGLDPLAKSYRELGIDSQKMLYVAGAAENIPFPDDYFEIVTSFNSLDHVDNIDKTIEEIIRVIKPGGMFLLITDVNHQPTATEPVSFSWDIIHKFMPRLKMLEKKHYEKGTSGMYDSIKAGTMYDHSNPRQRYGILSAKFLKCF
jgi:ubiquinone/menaquinone biosynthesis C-methylase UbiE